MTKKDFIVIAKVFAHFEVRRRAGTLTSAVDYLIDEFAFYAEQGNPRFDEPRFREFVKKEIAEGEKEYNQ